MNTARNMWRSGLTFLEVLLAVAMLGLLMVAGSTMLYSFTQAYFNLETGPQFTRHVDGITETLHYLSSLTSASDASLGRHYEWVDSPISKTPTLAFTFDHEVPLLVSPIFPLPPVKAYLEFQKDENQFWLVWYPDPKFTNNKPDYQYTLLSEWAGDIEYGYYDAAQKSWEFELASSGSRQKGSTRPQRIQLIFERQGQTLRRTIHLNSGKQNVLTY